MTLASDARAIARAGIRAVEPFRATRRLLRREGHGVRVGGARVAPGAGGRLHIIALGKAAGRMADAAASVLGRATPGLAVTAPGAPRAHEPIRTLLGDHPVPGARSLRAGRALLEYVARLGPADAVLFLISGGGSALAEVPADAITLADLQRTTDLLLGCGSPIEVDNLVRRHLSLLKGGRLAAALSSGRFGTVAISDVVGDSPYIIASGPTVADPTRAGDALAAARRYRIAARLPSRVRRYLTASARTKEGGRTGAAAAHPFVLAARNATAVEGAAAEARRRGYAVVVEHAPIVGDTRRAAVRFTRRTLALTRPPPRPRARIAGGETTVDLGPNPGRGGRNQEFALAGVEMLDGTSALVLSIGTDGIDGPTDAAGGWADGRTASIARRRAVAVDEALRRHDAYPALLRLGRRIRIGPTGTNVTDLHIGLAAGRPRRAGQSG